MIKKIFLKKFQTFIENIIDQTCSEILIAHFKKQINITWLNVAILKIQFIYFLDL